MPNNKLYFSCFTKLSQKKYTYQMLLSSKTKKSFQKWFFYSKLKNIPKGVRLTKCPVNKLDFGKKLRFLRKIVEGYPICPVNVFSYRRQNVSILIQFYVYKYMTRNQHTKTTRHYLYTIQGCIFIYSCKQNRFLSITNV